MKIPLLTALLVLPFSVRAANRPEVPVWPDNPPDHGALTEEPRMGPPTPTPLRRHTFSLLPKSIQRQPDLQMTLYCALTPYGKTLPKTTPENPTRYILHQDGMKAFGEIYGGHVSPAPEYLQRMLTRSLTVNGYLPATEDGPPPTLALFYYWGPYQAMDKEERLAFPEQALRQRLERAKLVGGDVFARQTDEALSFSRLFPRTTIREYLDYQAEHDLYYAIVSAYDYAALTRGERKLVWRANLTVNAEGVSLAESLPPLVLSAGPVLGRDTAEPLIVSRRVFRTWVDLKDTTFKAEPTAGPSATPRSSAP
jgi:hypothetical protein